MFRQTQQKAILFIVASAFLFITIQLLLVHINGSRNNMIYFNIYLTFHRLEKAKSLEVENEQKYQLTAVILHWKRSSRVRLAIQRYLTTSYFKQIIVWNNNPQINLTIRDVLIQNQSSDIIRIINSGRNLKDEAKYRACAEAETLVCFYADDDWDTSHYMNTLIASFRSDPNLLHSATNGVTYYNNMLWTFMDFRIDLHTGFSWIGSGSIFLRQHARRHLELLSMTLHNQTELFGFSDLFFSIWLNDIPSQMAVHLRSLPASTNESDIAFSSTNRFYDFQFRSSVVAIRKLHSSLISNESNKNISFPRKQNRRFPYCTRSPGPKDDFIFYSNVLPVDIEHMPFDIKVDSDRGTYRYVPGGPNYTHFVKYNTFQVVDNDENTCWRPIGFISKGHFFAMDFLRIQSNIVFSLIVGHSDNAQNSLDMRISFDGDWWISDNFFQTLFINIDRMNNTTRQRFIIDSTKFPIQLRSYRYVVFNATRNLDEPFQVCDVRIIKKV